MNKKELRQKQIECLKNYAATAAKELDDLILLEKLMNLKLLQHSQRIGVTSSLPYEVDTSNLIANLWEQGKEVYLARSYNNREHKQDFVAYNYNSKVARSKFGVEEVVDTNAKVNNELDLIIVPGVAFALDSKQRIGFGGGYYDRFLAKHPHTTTIALANRKMIFAHMSWQAEKTDIPLKTIITPHEI